MATKKTASSPSKAKKDTAKPVVPKRIFAQASPHSLGGTSVFEAQAGIDSSSAASFLSDPDLVNRAVLRLRDAGFDVLQISALTINIAGSPETYKRAFGSNIIADERPVIKELGERTTATFLDSSDTGLSGLINTLGTRFEDVLEGVAIEEPRYFMGASMFAPPKAYWHLRVPGDISLGCNADRAHRGGITGRGIKIAMVDSGHYKHPFFAGRGYRVSPVTLGPAALNPAKDESGHGTGESANIFAVAPDIQLLPVKVNFVNSIGAFNTAVALKPDIITCSWGSDNKNGPLSAADQALAAAISVAVSSGITVVFSAGNGHWGFPGQHPDVISAGGVFMNPDESLRASDYASGFNSNIYPNRRVPDLSGLVGMRPKAIYIMLPIEPGDAIDATPWNDPNGGLQGGTHPNGDETTNNDGWGAFSGTSAAAPQLAGAAALVKQACPSLKPAEIREILKKSARDVKTGNCHPNTGGNPAIVGPDTATGNGLVDAHKAVLLAKVKCLGPQPVQPNTMPMLLEGTAQNTVQTMSRGLSEDDVTALEELITRDDLSL
jgi:subtilisin family serine protease